MRDFYLSVPLISALVELGMVLVVSIAPLIFGSVWNLGFDADTAAWYVQFVITIGALMITLPVAVYAPEHARWESEVWRTQTQHSPDGDWYRSLASDDAPEAPITRRAPGRVDRTAMARARCRLDVLDTGPVLRESGVSARRPNAAPRSGPPCQGRRTRNCRS